MSILLGDCAVYWKTENGALLQRTRSLDLHNFHMIDFDGRHELFVSVHKQEGILYAHASIWAVEVQQRHFL